MSNGGESRVSIPNATREMIENIKEIMGNHSDEEIYAMLKECAMDPNETAQRLLSQDTFHEVKRKRDRKKENPNKDLAEPWWKSGTHGQGSRGGRVNYTPHHMSHDAGGGRNADPGKENGTHQVAENVSAMSLPIFQESKNKENTAASSATVVTDGPAIVPSGSTGAISASESSAGTGVNLTKSNLPSVEVNKLKSASSAIADTKKAPNIIFGSEDTSVQPTTTSSNYSVSKAPGSSSAVCFSSLDPVLPPSSDSRPPGAVGTIRCEVGSQWTYVEPNANASNVNKSTSVSDTGGTSTQEKVAVKALGVVKNEFSESSQPTSTSTQESSSSSCPSSSYSNQKQQLIGHQKVNSNKEWKPKTIKPNVCRQLVLAGVREIHAASIEARSQSQLVSCVHDSEEETAEVEKKLERLHLPQRQHVILPNHIHVPESQRSKLSFGSFGASFGLPTNRGSGPESENSSTPKSETSQVIEEVIEEQCTSNQNAQTSSEEGVHPDTTHPPADTPEALPTSKADASSSPVCSNSQPKQESELVSGGFQYSAGHTSPNYSAGFMPPVLGGQFTPIESSEPQAQDVSCIPSIIVQPQIDPTSYYTQFYRPGTDVDGRISPLTAPGLVAGKYVGNMAVFPQQMPQSQEGGNSLVLSTAAPLVTQTAGLMQTSVAVTQQAVPVFRPPGMPLSHFPPNYMPYGHYIPPFYVTPSGIHQFLGNSAFPSQPQAASVYPAPPPAPTAAVKYPLPPYKSGANTGSSTHIGVPSAYGLYGSSPAVYNPGSAPAGNSITNEDLSASQFKESNVYVTGQQNEGSAVWISAPGRDISSLPAGSYYSLPPQGGQHVTFTPTQASHTFAGLYHPAQAVTAASVHPLVQQTQGMAGAVDIVGAPPSGFQQRAQTNWPNNF